MVAAMMAFSIASPRLSLWNLLPCFSWLSMIFSRTFYFFDIYDALLFLSSENRPLSMPWALRKAPVRKPTPLNKKGLVQANTGATQSTRSSFVHLCKLVPSSAATKPFLGFALHFQQKVWTKVLRFGVILELR